MVAMIPKMVSLASTVVTKDSSDGIRMNHHHPSWSQTAQKKRQIAAAVVAADLLKALPSGGGGRGEDSPDLDCNDDLCDVYLIAAGGIEIPACRFVLAARSAVFRKMLYGIFREAKSTSIGLLGYSPCVVQAIVYFCSFHQLSPTLFSATASRSHSRTRTDGLSSLVQLGQAADYLQLPVLVDLVESHVLRLMVQSPDLVCTVLEESVAESRLARIALQMIECRPYVTLDVGGPSAESDGGSGGWKNSKKGVTVLSTEKLTRVLRNPAVGASEWFLFRMLARWYQSQLAAIEQEVDEEEHHHHGGGDTSSTTAAAVEELLLVTRELCQRYIRLANIEPVHLLSPTLRGQCPYVTSTAIFEAISKQALQASRDKFWRLQYRGLNYHKRGGSSSASSSSRSSSPESSSSPSAAASAAAAVDCVLVEGAGKRNVDGMYYRIAAGLASGSELYSKLEISVAQPLVYTLSRCLRNPLLTHSARDGQQPEQQQQPYYECRIFCSAFLTHRAVQNLQTMQATATIVPCFQPVLQILELNPPASTAASLEPWTSLGGMNVATQEQIPTPIRKYYRVRLSDGEYHMPGTFSPELNTLISGETQLYKHHVIKVLEFGVYTIFGCASIHVMKAVVVTTTPSFPFGDPIPLEEATSTATDETDTPITNDESASLLLPPNGLQNLYTCQCSTGGDVESLQRIPRQGWQLDDHGLEPAPECIWIPATTVPTTSTMAQLHASHTDLGNASVRTISVKKSGNTRYGNSISPRTVVTTEQMS